MTVWIVLMSLSGAVAGFWIGNRLAQGKSLPTRLILGAMSGLVTWVLLLIGLWPPIDPLTLALPLGYLGLLAGMLYFIRNLDPEF